VLKAPFNQSLKLEDNHRYSCFSGHVLQSLVYIHRWAESLWERD